MKTLLICHADDELDRLGMTRWLASFSELTGIVEIDESWKSGWRRIRRELKRVGLLRFMDVLAFRLYYRMKHSAADREWRRARLAELQERYPDIGADVPVLRVSNPNDSEAEEFIRRAAPNIMIARCKFILKEQIFNVPTGGTFVMHPGVCPEYRNAHGCFWALANDDLENVGMTLLRIDRGVDTGPVYGYYSYPFDEARESHDRIQARVVYENLDPLRERLLAVHEGRAEPLDTTGRASHAWGQPWLSRYLRWKRRARKRSAG